MGQGETSDTQKNAQHLIVLTHRAIWGNVLAWSPGSRYYLSIHSAPPSREDYVRFIFPLCSAANWTSVTYSDKGSVTHSKNRFVLSLAINMHCKIIRSPWSDENNVQKTNCLNAVFFKKRWEFLQVQSYGTPNLMSLRWTLKNLLTVYTYSC